MPANAKSFELIMRLFGYDHAWPDAGVIDSDFLREQFDEIQRSPDKNPEHYRSWAFQQFIARTTTLTNAQIDALLHLQDSGPDGWDESDNRALALVESTILTDEQLDLLRQRHPKVSQPPIQKRYRRACLRRRLKTLGLEATFSDLIASADPHLHQDALNHPELNAKHLEILATDGCNKSIRSRASHDLRSKRFRNDA